MFVDLNFTSLICMDHHWSMWAITGWVHLSSPMFIFFGPVHIPLWKITKFNGNTHYNWPFSIAMLPVCQGDSKTKPEPDIPIISQPQNPDATVGDFSKKFLAFAWSWLPKKNHVAVKTPNVLVNSASSGRNRLQRWSRGPNTPDLNNCEKCQENGKKKWGIGKMAGFVWRFLLGCSMLFQLCWLKNEIWEARCLVLKVSPIFCSIFQLGRLRKK